MSELSPQAEAKNMELATTRAAAGRSFLSKMAFGLF